MDMFQLESISTINFLSSCTVLSMSCHSVGKAMLAGEKKVNMHTGSPLALGAAFGGIVGRSLNRRMDNQAVDKLFIGLMVIIIGISVYNALHCVGVL